MAAFTRRTAYLRLLGFLQGDLLARIAHALALVWLRRAALADGGRDFADDLLVGTLDEDFGLRRHFDGDAFGRLEDHRMRETEGKVEVLALQRGAVADADEFELARVPFADAGDHVADQRAGGAG